MGARYVTNSFDTPSICSAARDEPVEAFFASKVSAAGPRSDAMKRWR